MVPRLLLKTVRDLTTRSGPGRCIGSNRMALIFRLPSRKVRVGLGLESTAGLLKPWTMIRHAPATGCAFQAMLCRNRCWSQLEYQETGQGVRSRWEVPRLLDGGVVLQVLWEVRLPWNLELVGVPRDWSDENQWYWDGYAWKQRPWRNVSSVNEWILGTTTSSTAVDEFDGANPDDSHHYLFSRSGQPVALSVWVVSRPGWSRSARE